MEVEGIVNNIFSVNDESFTDLAIQTYKYQYLHNNVYNRWVKALKIDALRVSRLQDIPFMPVSFFKGEHVKTGSFNAEVIFESSGTTGSINSRHYVKDVNLYRQSFITGFQHFYGSVQQYCIIGLLPSYLEREGSSLILMVDELIKATQHPLSGFYLNDHRQLAETLLKLEAAGTKTLLIGVTFALLAFSEQYRMNLKHTTVMEAGGMKGRRKEITRPEVHAILKERMGVNDVHSEYGMTELLSQAYSKQDGRFTPVPWMKLFVRDEDDPLQVSAAGKGVLNIIDLANINSCSFIATDDVGTVTKDYFEVSGRLDISDVRGCSLLTV